MEKTETFGPRDSENFLKNLSDPRGTVKYVQTTTESFRLFLTGVMVNNIVD